MKETIEDDDYNFIILSLIVIKIKNVCFDTIIFNIK